MTVAINAIQLGGGMRECATTGHWDREIERNARVGSLLPICDIFKEVFGLGFEACSAEAEGVILGIGVTVVGVDRVDELTNLGGIV